MPEKKTTKKTDQEIEADWGIWRKIFFRFSFAFLGLMTLFGNNVLSEIFYPEFITWTRFMSLFGQPLYFFDKHFFHVGYTPDPHTGIVISDKPIGWVLLFTIFFLSVFITAIWSVIDRRRKQYRLLDFWFKWYLAYYLFLCMDFYAVFKIFLVQMPFPNADSLLAPLAQHSMSHLLFDTVGVSPTYSILTGLFEFTAAILLLNRKTRMLGTVLMLVVLVNVVSLNLCYNINVKLLSLLMLSIDLFLMMPYMSRLIKFFGFSKPDVLFERENIPVTKWKTNLFNLFVIITCCWVTIDLIIRSEKVEKIINTTKQHLYDVSGFASQTEPLPASAGDTLRIKKLLFTAFYGHCYAVVFDSKDSTGYYDYTWDDHRQKIHLIPLKKRGLEAEFSYQALPNHQLKLIGMYQQQNVQMLLNEVSLNNLRIVQEKFTWVQRNDPATY